MFISTRHNSAPRLSCNSDINHDGCQNPHWHEQGLVGNVALIDSRNWECSNDHSGLQS